jgi:hypothetical protein
MRRKSNTVHLLIGVVVLTPLLLIPVVTSAGTSDQGLKPSELKGVIFSLDAEEGRVVVEKPLGSNVPVLTKHTTKIYKDGKRVDFDALQVGDKVTVEWLPGPRIAREIWAFSNTEK